MFFEWSPWTLQLLDELEESESLKGSYIAQSRLFNEDNLLLVFPPLAFDGEARQPAAKSDPLGVDITSRLAMAEIDPSLASFDFNSVPGIKALLARPIEEIR